MINFHSKIKSNANGTTVLSLEICFSRSFFRVKNLNEKLSVETLGKCLDLLHYVWLEFWQSLSNV